MNHSSLTSAYLRWALFHTALGRGWWLVTAVYLVVVAELSPPQLILIGVFQGITVVIAEIPAGVIADAVSRRLAVVLSHLVMGTGMAMTAFVTDFPVLVISNCLWGLGWALVSGADVAWITDELERPDLIDSVLASKARYGLLGTVAGIISFGALASVVSLQSSMAAAGISMVALGVVFVTRWPEDRFEPAAAGRRWSHGTAILRRGVSMARADRMIFLVLAGTLLVNGGSEGFGRLFESRLIDVGMPIDPDPIVWFAALALLAAALGAIALRFVEARVHGADVARQTYLLACSVGTVGLVMFAHAPSTPAAVAGALLVSGIALPLTRTASVILVNRRATKDVRATLHSMLSEAENLGEIAFGLVLAVIAGSFSAAATLTGSAVLIACAGVAVARTRQR